MATYCSTGVPKPKPKPPGPKPKPPGPWINNNFAMHLNTLLVSLKAVLKKVSLQTADGPQLIATRRLTNQSTNPPTGKWLIGAVVVVEYRLVQE